MEFRQVVQVCRSAAAATRPSLIRPAPSSLLFQHHQFSTDSKRQQLEAAAPAQPQSETPLPNTQSSPQYRVDQLRSGLENPPSSFVPRRPPIRSNNFFLDQSAKPTKSWTSPLRTAPKAGAGARPAISLTGKAPAGPSDVSAVLPGQIDMDMQQATSDMGTWKETDFMAKFKLVPQSEMRLRPSTGRTIEVKGNVDLARGLRLLQRSVAQNRIQRDLRLQRAHERPALKRKRMKRERWQVRFKDGFKATIARAMELKKQGW
ncbi:hypothetical protein VTI74DRAFT_3813 [Chaetomium olivicolor]